ncbi:glycoside hydrolase family 43 protein [Actinacidiphila oryziradicis]|uniref:glycoside hydrolase family 43 protein n=1 Tax=Actinacidiphila oryziradicis TaxID=2571141 RepID=UPI001FEB0FD3|nr:glycoside hydrolase family 43 protein [Actinacidiphila oryziradicis]
MTAIIHNPVLSGFHPDPSILRVGPDYYLATSTFEWMPGVTLHHSTDLLRWEPLGGALGTTRLLDMVGTVDSGGVWAPCLSYADGLFHLVYTHMVHNVGPYRDLRNYVVTSPSPTGPWSDPVPLHNRGFDPSFFHEDGRTWLLAMQHDHRPGRDSFAGITLQEWSREHRRLIGPVRRILGGTGRGCTEGPHLYRRDGWYLLLVADGGTGASHGAAVARSRCLEGPYELHPEPLITTRDDERHPLQKAGHGCLVDTPDGEWFMAYLCSRPLPGTGRSVLGRETALHRVEWTEDGWPRIPGGRPALTIPAPASTRPGDPVEACRYRFREDFTQPRGNGSAALNPRFLTLRLPPDSSWLDLRARPGHLRLRGQESLASPYRQSMVAHRQTATRCGVRTLVDFRPSAPQQMAGLTHFYNTKLWHYLHLTWDEVHGRVLRLGSLDFQTYTESATVPVAGDAPVHLRVDIDGPAVRFAWSLDGDRWEPIGPELDGSLLSDEYATRTVRDRITNWGFTGSVVGLAAQDLTGGGLSADFDFFDYTEA